MTTLVPLEAIPSQQLQILLDGVRYTLEVRQIAESTLIVSVWRGSADGVDTVVIRSVVAGSRTPIIPYQYLEGSGGNFYFDTPNDELPDYTQFGGRHLLIYASAAELAEVRV